MKLSIITINYNNHDGLQKTIDSVITQTYKDFEWIVIDGGSTDGSKELIEKYSDHITYWVSEPDKGIYNAMNKGVKKANGEYLNFMNSGDCFYNNDVLNSVIPYLNGTDICVGDIVNDHPEGQKLVTFPRNNDTKTILDQLIFKFFPHPSSFIRNNLLKKYGNYREDLQIASDWYFFFHSIVIGNASIRTIPFPIVLFDCNGISNTHNNRINERQTSLTTSPVLQQLYVFYRDNLELSEAFNSTKLGRFIMRLYFFIYRQLH